MSDGVFWFVIGLTVLAVLSGWVLLAVPLVLVGLVGLRHDRREFDSVEQHTRTMDALR